MFINLHTFNGLARLAAVLAGTAAIAAAGIVLANEPAASAATTTAAGADAQSEQVNKYTSAQASATSSPADKPAKRKTSLTATKRAGTTQTTAARTASAKPKPPARDPKATSVLNLAGVGDVTVYAPKGEARGLALFASGDGNWNLGVWDMAQTAADVGYWVAGFSTPAFLKSLENGDGECSDASGLLDHIGSKVKTEFKLPEDWRPVLIGYSSGATIMYAALAQAGDTRFGGAMTLGFCPDLIIHKPFCEGAGLTADKQTKPPYGIVFNTVPAVKAPWIVLQGDIDQVCNPPATEAFVGQVKGGRVVMLPKVGHGYSVPRNWMPQYRQGLIDLLDTAQPSRVADVRN